MRIAIKEKINELRAKQRGHSLAEEDCLKEVAWHMERQAQLEDEILALGEIEKEIHENLSAGHVAS